MSVRLRQLIISYIQISFSLTHALTVSRGRPKIYFFFTIFLRFQHFPMSHNSQFTYEVANGTQSHEMKMSSRIPCDNLRCENYVNRSSCRSIVENWCKCVRSHMIVLTAIMCTMRFDHWDTQGIVCSTVGHRRHRRLRVTHNTDGRTGTHTQLKQHDSRF